MAEIKKQTFESDGVTYQKNTKGFEHPIVQELLRLKYISENGQGEPLLINLKKCTMQFETEVVKLNFFSSGDYWCRGKRCEDLPGGFFTFGNQFIEFYEDTDPSATTRMIMKNGEHNISKKRMLEIFDEDVDEELASRDYRKPFGELVETLYYANTTVPVGFWMDLMITGRARKLSVFFVLDFEEEGAAEGGKEFKREMKKQAQVALKKQEKKAHKKKTLSRHEEHRREQNNCAALRSKFETEGRTEMFSAAKNVKALFTADESGESKIDVTVTEVQEAAKKANVTLDAVNQFLEAHGPKIKKGKELLTDERFVTSRIYDFLKVIIKSDKIEAIIDFVMRTLIDLGVTYKLGLEVISHIKKLFLDESSIEEGVNQGGIDVIQSGLTAVLVSVCAVLKGCVPSASSIGKFVVSAGRQLGAIGQCKRGIDAISALIPWLKRMYESAICWIFGEQDPAMYHLAQLAMRKEEIVAWAREAKSMCNATSLDRLMTDTVYNAKLSKVVAQGDCWENLILQGDIKGPPCVIIKALQAELRKVYNTVRLSNQNLSMRYDPFCIQIAGASRLGKSAATVRLLTDMCLQTGEPTGNNIYFRGQSDHWDGYYKQFACVYDDFAQMVDSTHPTELINIKTNNPYILKCADLKDKGRGFESKVILLTSNSMNPNCKTVYHPEAVYRRRDVLLKMIDCRCRNEAKSEMENRCFIFHNPMPTRGGRGENETETGIHFTYEELVVEIVKRFKHHTARQEKLIADTVKRPVKPACFHTEVEIAEFKKIKQSMEFLRQEEFEAAGVYKTPPYIDTCVCTLEGSVTQGLLSDDSDVESLYCDATEDDPQPSTSCRNKSPNTKRNIAIELAFSKHGASRVIDNAYRLTKDFCSGPLERETGASIWGKALGYIQQETKAIRHQVFNLDELPVNVSTSLIDTINLIKTIEFKNRLSKEIFIVGDLKITLQDFVYLASLEPEFKDGRCTISVDSEHPTALLFLLLPAAAQRDILSRAKLLILDHLNNEGDEEGIFRFFWRIFKKALNKLKELNEKFKWLKYMVGAAGSLLAAYLFFTREKDDVTEAYHAGQARHISRPQLMTEGNFYASGGVRHVNKHILRTEAQTFEQMARKLVKKDPERFAKPMEKYYQEVLGKSFTQGCVDTNAQSVIDKVIGNLYKIRNDNSNYSMHCMGLFGTTAVLPRHFVDNSKDGDVLLLEGAQNCTAIFERARCHFFSDEEVGVRKKDFCLYEFGPQMRSFKDITNHILDDADLPKAKGSPGCLVVKKGDTLWSKQIQTLGLASDIPALDEKSGQRYISILGWKYDVDTEYGYCGAPVFVFNKRIRGKLIGFHVTGFKQGGAAHVLTKRMVIENAPVVQGAFEMPELEVEPLTDEKSLSKAMVWCENPNITMLGVYPSNLSVRIPSKSKIEPSLIQGVYPVITEPAILSPADPRSDGSSMLAKGLDRWCRRTIPFPPKYVEELRTLRVRQLENLTSEGFPRRLLTLDENVNGARHISEYLDGLNLTTSPGYPYSLFREPGSVGKRQWFIARENGIDYDPEPALIGTLDDAEALLLRGERPLCIFTAQLKDEERPLVDGKPKDTRTFCMANMIQTMLGRKYFQMYRANKMEHHVDVSSKVGIDPTGPSWTENFERHLKVGTKSICGDYKKFDGSTYPAALDEYARLANMWYHGEYCYDLYWPKSYLEMEQMTEEDYQIFCQMRARHILMEMAAHRYEINGNTMVLVDHGMPSGSDATSDCNGEVGVLFIYCSIRAILDRLSIDFEPEQFYTDFCLDVYGDDNALTVSDAMAKYITFRSLKEELAKHNILYTPANKSDTEYDFVDVNDISFLKRSYVRHPKATNLFLAPLEQSVVESMVNWTQQCSDMSYATREVADASAREAFHHGPAFFRTHVEKLNKALKSVGVEMIYHTYEALERAWFKKFQLSP